VGGVFPKSKRKNKEKEQRFDCAVKRLKRKGGGGGTRKRYLPAGVGNPLPCKGRQQFFGKETTSTPMQLIVKPSLSRGERGWVGAEI